MSGKQRIEFNRRLGESWRDLCDYLEMPGVDRAKLEAGSRGSGIWLWLEERKRIHELSAALRDIGREDLVETVPASGEAISGSSSAIVSIGHLPQPGRHFVGRDTELALLDEAWANPQTNIAEFVAFGGVGKSALVAEWLKQMRADRFRGAARVFGHSFYSQGSREDAQASADSFLDQSLRFFGENEEEAMQGSPWDKGERLARRVRQQPTLLILDGVEPLQSPGTDDDAGQVRDPGLQALLVELAAQMNGLVVISTRARVADIVGWEDSTVVSRELEHLSVDAGCQLLHEIGVDGTEAELSAAVQEVDGHALSITLIGRYVVKAASGHIEDRHEIGLHEIGQTLAPTAGRVRNPAHTTRTFARIMQRYEVWLSGLKDGEGNIDNSGRMALEIVRLTGLFDRPITAGEFAALVGKYDEEAHTKARRHKEDDENLPVFVPSRENPPIPGLTDQASAAIEGEVNLAIGRLVEYGLITKVTGSRIRLSVPAWPDEAASEVVLDAHPLVREFFAKRLAESERGSEPDESRDSPSGALGVSASVREAHRRLYEHLKQSAPERPDNLNDMMPLYHAVAHGCKAGYVDDAVIDVYYLRIQRESDFFAIKKLGAIGSSISAISSAFDQPFTDPSTELNGDHKSFVASQAGFCLRALGRVRETAAPMEFTVKERSQLGDLAGATAAASNLSELSLTLGDVSSAVRQGEQSVELADRSGDAFHRMSKRGKVAAALFCAGDFGRSDEGGRMKKEDDSPFILPPSSFALAAFREAEVMQQERQPQYPLLYSLAGYQYCELLLAHVCQRIRELNVQCRPRNVQTPGAGAETEEGHNKPIALAPSTSSTSSLDIQSEIESLRNRAETTLSWGSGPGILDVALNHLTLGRTWQLSALLESGDLSPLPISLPVESADQEHTKPQQSPIPILESPIGNAEHHLTQSVNLLRQAGQQQELPRGLLHRAALWRDMLALASSPRQGECRGTDHSEGGEQDEGPPAHPSPELSPQGERDFYALAERDLSEAESIAERGSMLIWQIEAALGRSQLFLTLHEIGWEGETPAEPRSGDVSQAGSLRHVANDSVGASPSGWLELAREKLEETKKLVEKTESEYEPHVPDWEEWEPPEYVGVFKKGEIVGYHCRNQEIADLDAEISRLEKDRTSQV